MNYIHNISGQVITARISSFSEPSQKEQQQLKDFLGLNQVCSRNRYNMEGPAKCMWALPLPGGREGQSEQEDRRPGAGS